MGGLVSARLDRSDRKTGKITHFVLTPGDKNGFGEGTNVDCIYRDTVGYLWVGGGGSGLVRFDERTGRFEHYRHNGARPEEAKEQLDRSIERAAKAISEGRDAVQGLGASTGETNDLARAVNSLGEEMTTDPANHAAPAFRVTVEGEPRDLHPILRDEVYRIAAEALRNAYHHAAAQQVEVEIRYDNQQFRLRVRDDGKGVDTAVLSWMGCGMNGSARRWRASCGRRL